MRQLPSSADYRTHSIFKWPHDAASKRSAAHPWLILIALLVTIPLIILENTTKAHSTGATEPIFSHPGGNYQQDVNLKIDASHPEGEILFTMDGSIPSKENGEAYRGPIPLNVDTPGMTVIRAREWLPDGELGPIVSSSYLLGMETGLPVMSLIIDPADLEDPERGISANPMYRGKAWERPVDVIYLSEGQIGFHVPAGLRIHGNSTRNIEKTSYRLYFREEYGMRRLNYPLFASSEGSVRALEESVGSSDQSFKRLVLHDGGQDFAYPGYGANWTLLRTRLINDLAKHTRVYTTQSQPTLLFINGELRGIYLIRNFVDDWYYADELGIEARVEEEAKEHWEHFLDFLANHDMADPTNYLYTQSQVNVENLIDYTIMQIYIANTDWLYTNVKRFLPNTQGGRWNWILWDVDYGFGLAPWGDYDLDMIDYIYFAERPGLEPEARPFRKLMENPDFRELFLVRAADLLNTVLAEERVIARIDELASELRDDIQHEEALWSSPGDWETSVDYLREYARQRPDWMRRHLVQHFGLTGTTEIGFQPPVDGAGLIAVDGMLLPRKMWEGRFFKETTIQVTAVPEPGFCFAGWLPAELRQKPTIAVTVNEPRNIIPVFRQDCAYRSQAGDVMFTHVQADDDEGAIEGDWFRLQVSNREGVDLRGWRITDNDSKTATDEGSLILPVDDSLSQVPWGTSILIVASRNSTNDALFPLDDLTVSDRHMVLYVGNEHLDSKTDLWFNLTENDTLVLLAPGPTASFHDDRGVALTNTGDYNGNVVTSASFGILEDGVTTGVPEIFPQSNW